MFHFVAHSTPGTLLFTDWTEARALWQRLRSVPGLRALMLMPNHIHLISSVADERAVTIALRSYARWRNHHRGQHGPVWQPRPPADPLPDPKHARRSIRYLHLNPCRARLVPCPAAWPFSTHRDALGLALDPVRERVSDAPGFHSYVSSDPSVSVTGTPYPGDRLRGDRIPMARLAGAVSELARAPLADVYARPHGRRLLIGVARELTSWSGGDIAVAVGVHRSQVARAPQPPRGVCEQVARMVADERFPGLIDRDPRLRRR